MEGRCLCAIGWFASGALIELRCATIGNNGMVRLTIEGSRTGTVYERLKYHQNAPYDILPLFTKCRPDILKYTKSLTTATENNICGPLVVNIYQNIKVYKSIATNAKIGLQ